MFEELKFLGTRETEISLSTRRGTPIRNSQSPAPDQAKMTQFQLILKSHPAWTVRKSPCGIYNCAGHVWASRRTSIYEDEAYRIILEEDGYRKLAQNEVPQPGDLALYWLSDRPELIHVGMMAEIRTLQAESGPIPFVLSKWDDGSGEVIHPLEDVPWKRAVDHRLEIWTDRER